MRAALELDRQRLRLVVEEAVSREGRTDVHDEVVYGAVSRVHDVRLVLEQFIDAFDDIPFPEHDFIPHGHEPVPHIGLEAVYEMNALVKE